MNIEVEISKMLADIQTLDKWTQLSILGSYQFSINASCINNAMRYVPTVPDETDIDTYTPYEQARKKYLQDAEESRLPALLALRAEVESAINEVDGNGSLLRTLEYLNERLPKRSDIEAQYERQRRSGMRPINRKAWIDTNYAEAMAKHAVLVAKGEHAVRLCETIDVADRGYGDLPDYWLDKLFEIFVKKGRLRWEKLESDRTDPRLMRTRRDDAAADQLILQALFDKYGEAYAVDLDPEEAVEAIKPQVPFNDDIPFGEAA